MLITEGDNVGVLAMVRGLARAGYEPWVAAARRGAPAARSRSAAGTAIVPDPAESVSAFGDAIARLAATIEPVAILPGGELGMLALADMAEAGAPIAARLAVGSRASVHRATDKGALAELAAGAGLEVPPTATLTADEAAHGPLPVALPAVVKPLRSVTATPSGFAACSVRRAGSRAEVVDALRALPGERGLVQPYLQGELYGVGGVSWKGEIVAAVHQRAVRTWPAGLGEMAYAVAVARDPELERCIARLLTDLRWSGMFQLQFLETAEGRLLIDLNPRVYGSLSLALAAGQNLAAIWVDLLRGRSARPGRYRAGVSFRNEFLDAKALLARPGPTRLRALTRSVTESATTYAFFESGDPMPLVSLGPTLAVKLRSRAWLAGHAKTG